MAGHTKEYFELGLCISLYISVTQLSNFFRKIDSRSSKPYGEFQSEEYVKSQFLNQMISYSVRSGLSI
jgi:hypothetical protein